MIGEKKEGAHSLGDLNLYKDEIIQVHRAIWVVPGHDE
jgi:hypothetical protein